VNVATSGFTAMAAAAGSFVATGKAKCHMSAVSVAARLSVWCCHRCICRRKAVPQHMASYQQLRCSLTLFVASRARCATTQSSWRAKQSAGPSHSPQAPQQTTQQTMPLPYRQALAGPPSKP
jgi:hypothetical protein